MAGETGLSQIVGAPDLAGLRAEAACASETWKLSPDPQFIAKVRDVVGLYMSPPENALVLRGG